MSKARTPFDILGVTPADDMTTIRMAWRAKVRALHPDRARDKALATAGLAEVNSAFDALQGHVPQQDKRVAQAPCGDVDRSAPKRRGCEKQSSQADRRLVNPERKAPPVREQVARPARKSTRSRPDRTLAELYEKAVAGYMGARPMVKAA